ncbi:MAG TPA: H-NS histone family protein [Burkholderiaceae bacterium]
MQTLEQLLEQQKNIEREIARLQAESKATAIAEIRALMSSHGLTMADIAEQKAVTRRSAMAGRTVEPKYRGPDGATWSGRGLKPRWLQQALSEGAQLSDFAVERSGDAVA